MNNKTRIKDLYKIAPEYPRIPHLDKSISNMTHDDIQIESKIQFPFTGWVQEKLDGANMGVSWLSGPIIRNRNNILKKGYIKKETPAKVQFRSAWNWIHGHNKDIQKLSKSLMSPVTLYGEWLYAKHSIYYDRLPDLFIAYDIYLSEYNEWISPDIFKSEMKETNIHFIEPELKTFYNISEIVEESEKKSIYRNGIREGIVIKTSDGSKINKSFKIVNKMFDRREDFNEELIKNSLITK
jgi:atypical dual specificity phosphatase